MGLATTARIGVLPAAFVSHIIPLFRICRELMSAGYSLTVLGSDAIRPGHSEMWGRYITAFGLIGRDRVPSDPELPFPHWFVQQLKELKLDVIILDAFWQGLAYVCQELPVKCVVVHHAGLPDFRFEDMPAWYYVHPRHSAIKWAVSRCVNEIKECTGRGVRPLFLQTKALSSSGQARGSFGFGCGEFDSIPAIRAMSLCPAVEFPKERGRIVYLGTVLPTANDIDWTPVPAQLVDTSRTLIVCAFGTSGLSSESEGYEWLVCLARTLAASFPSCQVVAVVDKRTLDAFGAHNMGENVSFHSWIPLWELLSTRKTRKILVSPPGVGAFREAVSSGTPVVAIPRIVDQFGAAARVDYFGIGSVLLSQKLPPVKLVAKHVGRVLEAPGVYSRVELLRQEIAGFDAPHPLRRFVDDLCRR